ncbi:MAG: dehydrogenase [Opitutales bacterium]
MKIIRAKAPLRLGLAGGGTDVSPYCDQFGGNVLNATIDLYAYCTIEPWDEPTVAFRALDKESEESFPLAAAYDPSDGLCLHKAVYNHIVKHFNHGEPLPHRLNTYCDAPPGSGLGSSSTIVVSMIQAYAEWLKLPLGEYDIAFLAYKIERLELGQKGGRQDQYAATFGGINFIEFYEKERVIVNPLRVKDWILNEFEGSLLLYYTAISRESFNIISEQVKNIEKSEKSALESTHTLKKDALRYKEALLKGDLRSIADILKDSWEAKKKLAHSITNSQVDAAFDTAMNAGAYAGKVSGAGGGGFIAFMTDPLRKPEVAKALEPHNGRIIPFHFTHQGAQAWTGRL